MKKDFREMVLQLFSILLGFGIFILVVPFGIVYFGRMVDSFVGVSYFAGNIFWFLLGVILMVLGIFFVLWAGFSQLRFGKGTPVPIAPTKKLVVIGAYRYCRNPMLLGSVLGYLSISFLIGSIGAVGFTIIFLVLSCFYIELVEEKELERRFGDEYKCYKEEVPFMFPKFFRR